MNPACAAMAKSFPVIQQVSNDGMSECIDEAGIDSVQLSWQAPNKVAAG